MFILISLSLLFLHDFLKNHPASHLHWVGLLVVVLFWPPALPTQGARRAVPHSFPDTFPHTFPLLPGRILPFPIHNSTEVQPASLTGLAMPGTGAAAEPSGTSPGQPRPLLTDTPCRPCCAWAQTPKPQGEGEGVQTETTHRALSFQGVSSDTLWCLCSSAAT